MLDCTAVAKSVAKALLKQGILGAVIVLLLITCAALWKAYINSNEGRLKDGQECSSKYQGLLERVKDALADTNKALELIKDLMGPRT